MVERYSRKVMRDVWTEENKFNAYLEVEILSCEAWSQLGVVPKEDVAKVVEYIDGKGMACSVYFAQYFLEALCEAERFDLAVKYMAASGDRSWKGMIDFGSTISMEAWNVKVKPNLDLNHAWGAAPINIISVIFQRFW